MSSLDRTAAEAGNSNGEKSMPFSLTAYINEFMTGLHYLNRVIFSFIRLLSSPPCYPVFTVFGPDL